MKAFLRRCKHARVGETENRAVVERTLSIFQSQQVYIFNSTPEEELKAAFREASAIDRGCARSLIAENAATKQVMDMAEKVRDIHKNEDDVDCIVTPTRWNTTLVMTHPIMTMITRRNLLDVSAI